MFGAIKGIAARRPTFCLVYWFFYLDGHTFVLAAILLEPLAWPLVERSLGVERSLSAFPDTFYERC